MLKNQPNPHGKIILPPLRPCGSLNFLSSWGTRYSSYSAFTISEFYRQKRTCFFRNDLWKIISLQQRKNMRLMSARVIVRKPLCAPYISVPSTCRHTSRSLTFSRFVYMYCSPGEETTLDVMVVLYYFWQGWIKWEGKITSDRLNCLRKIRTNGLKSCKNVWILVIYF